MMDPVARFFEDKPVFKSKTHKIGRSGAVGFIILALVNPGDGILFLIFTGIIQTIDGYVVKPKLYGDSLGVSSLWILIAIICGGKMFGVVGVLLAIPFAAIVQYLLEEILFPKVKEERWKNYEDVKKD